MMILSTQNGRLARGQGAHWQLFERVTITAEGHGLYERAGTAGSEAEARAWVARKSNLEHI